MVINYKHNIEVAKAAKEQFLSRKHASLLNEDGSNSELLIECLEFGYDLALAIVNAEEISIEELQEED